MKLKVRIAILIGRALSWNTGSSKTMPWWTQHKALFGWHIITCRLCWKEIKTLTLKKGWGCKSGVKGKENYIFCADCYDAIDL